MLLHAPSVHFVWQCMIGWGQRKKRTCAHAEIPLELVILKKSWHFATRICQSRENDKFKVKRVSEHSLYYFFLEQTKKERMPLKKEQES